MALTTRVLAFRNLFYALNYASHRVTFIRYYLRFFFLVAERFRLRLVSIYRFSSVYLRRILYILQYLLLQNFLIVFAVIVP